MQLCIKFKKPILKTNQNENKIDINFKLNNKLFTFQNLQNNLNNNYFAGTLKINPTPKTFSTLKPSSSFKYFRILVIKTSKLLPKK